jgi:tetratricopeptide (TPR) repeat protein
MSRIRGAALAALASVLLCAGQAAAQGVGVGAVDAAEAARWREDLRYAAAEMRARHQNLFHNLTPARFESAVGELDARIPTLARHQIIVELARIAALVGDGHTNVYPTRDPKIGFHTLPFKLYLFKDGLFVRAARREQVALVGSRVLSIGGVPAEEAVTRVGELVGRDNEMGVRFFAPALLVMPEVLHATGMSNRPDGAQFVFERGGRRETLALEQAGPVELMPADTDVSWIKKEGWVDLRDGAREPLWLKDPQDKFWFEHMPEARAVYAQINQVGDKEKETLADFSARLFSFVESNPVEKLVLDLRLNRGGNGGLLRPLVVAAVRSKLNRRGHLFALIGRGSFSATQFLLNDLEGFTEVIFVGEPSASKGNAYGDSRRITLPNSGVTVRVSVYYWQDWAPYDTRLWTAPQVTAELSSEDYRAGVDPVLKAALEYAPRRSLAEILSDALSKGGVESAVKAYREFRAEPVNKYAEVTDALLGAGQRLLNEKKPEQALAFFKLNAEANPHAYYAHFAVGEALLRMGDKEQAARNFEKALELNPKSYEASQGLKEARRR